jgi:hypothetical protein
MISMDVICCIFTIEAVGNMSWSEIKQSPLMLRNYYFVTQPEDMRTLFSLAILEFVPFDVH